MDLAENPEPEPTVQSPGGSPLKFPELSLAQLQEVVLGNVGLKVVFGVTKSEGKPTSLRSVLMPQNSLHPLGQGMQE